VLRLPLAANPCDDNQRICELAWNVTENERVARWSDVLLGKPLAILFILVGALVARWVLFKLVDRVTRRAERGVLPDNLADSTSVARRKQRSAAMSTVLKSVITGLLIAIAITMILSELGVNIAPIIASAGILGLAVGFGAQSLVKDIVSGLFILVEDQYGVGDVIDLGRAIGTVEAVTLRVTRLRDINGVVWYVPNGQILEVGNMSQNWSAAVIDVSVAYDEDLARVKRVLREVSHDLWGDDEFRGVIVEEPQVTGVEALAADGVTVRVMLKTAPLEQWSVARELRQRIKARFDFEGIEIPFPQRVVWHRQESGDGEAAEMRAQDSGRIKS
jgi:moderate conductance mechanosensitive channel